MNNQELNEKFVKDMNPITELYIQNLKNNNRSFFSKNFLSSLDEEEFHKFFKSFITSNIKYEIKKFKKKYKNHIVNFSVEQALIAGIFEVFTFYCIYKNENLTVEKTKSMIRKWMRCGEEIFFIKIITNDYFISNKISALNLLEEHVNSSNKKEIKCLHLLSEMSDKTIDEFWNYVDSTFFPKLTERFAPNYNYITKYIEVADKKQFSGYVALFHLGLLGTYKQKKL